MKTQPLLITITAAALFTGNGLSIAVAADPNGSLSESRSGAIGVSINDTAITDQVKAKLMSDPKLKEAEISVSTVNGAVTLAGAVKTSDLKSAAGDLAKSVEGVVSVDNDIKAPSLVSKIEKKAEHVADKTGSVVSDSWITTKVKSALLADSVTKGLKISVKTVNHVVILSGAVRAQDSVGHAADLARQIKGVESVDTTGLKADAS